MLLMIVENWFRKQSTCKYYFAYSEWDIASFEESPMKTAGLITILTGFLYGKNFEYAIIQICISVLSLWLLLYSILWGKVNK